jgi:hypothetical protein
MGCCPRAGGATRLLLTWCCIYPSGMYDNSVLMVWSDNGATPSGGGVKISIWHAY